MLRHACYISKHITIHGSFISTESAGLLCSEFVHREESSRRRRKERGRALRRYLLIGLATVGGGTVLGVFKYLLISLNAYSTV